MSASPPTSHRPTTGGGTVRGMPNTVAGVMQHMRADDLRPTVGKINGPTPDPARSRRADIRSDGEALRAAYLREEVPAVGRDLHHARPTTAGGSTAETDAVLEPVNRHPLKEPSKC